MEPLPPVADEGVTTDEALVEEQLAKLEKSRRKGLENKMSLDSNIYDIKKVNKMDHHGSTLLAPEIKGALVNNVTVKFGYIEYHKAFIKVR